MSITFNGQTFSVEMTNPTDTQLKILSEAMSAVQEANCDYAEKLAKELNISVNCAFDVMYLRTRSRHTPEKEQELINLHKAGTPPNMCEF